MGEFLEASGAIELGRGYETKALIINAGFNKLERVQHFLARGVEVNSRDRSGTTALMRASMSGGPKVVNLLLKKGADVNAKNKDGWTA